MVGDARELFGKCGKKTLAGQQQLAIVGQIQVSAHKFGIICAENKEAIHSLVEENKKRENGNYVMYHDMDTFYSHSNLIGKMSMIWLSDLVLVGKQRKMIMRMLGISRFKYSGR